MGKSKLTVGVYIFLVFASGAVAGAFGHRLYTQTTVQAVAPQPRNAEEWRKKYVDEMQTRLKLNPEQVTKLGTVLDETRRRYQDMRERSKPEMTAIHDNQVTKVRALLNDVQRAEYEKMQDEREKKKVADGR